ncbi:hypothetical protein BOTCAL_0020g00040 [Botryotinia calthae]|uniref:Uncharacterized protein n=1 Tax=Botryotinia calthae TaxID=38488 RepID=A0A4Y8DEX7_9HELO|nr:hypothetical protein BOTCAL_0020g00040 [Botryotinia calthae]
MAGEWQENGRRMAGEWQENTRRPANDRQQTTAYSLQPTAYSLQPSAYTLLATRAQVGTEAREEKKKREHGC